MLLFFLCVFSLLAGFVDSVVGGGGLIQIPAMLILMPGTRLAIAKGSRFVRIFFLVVVTALIAKLAQSIIAP